jgi:predicted phage terminase large subunit-like protein
MEPYDVLTLPGVATDVRHKSDPRKPGQALWPWLRDEKALEMARLTEPRDFYALEQQDPRGEGATEWEAALFGPEVWFDEWPKADDIVVATIGLDPSKGKDAKHGDYSALVTFIYTKDGTIWVEADLARRTTTRIVSDAMTFFERIEDELGRPVDGLACESDQFQELLADELIRFSRENSINLNGKIWKMTTHNVPKEVRIRRLSPHITSKKIRYRATSGTRLLVRQLQEFPTGDHDDGPDALEYARRLATKFWRGIIAKRKAAR